MREVLNLNFGWRFSPEFRPEYARLDFKDSSFKLVDIPHTMCDTPLNYAGEKAFQKIACYRKAFMLPKSMRGRRLILHFEGVMGCAAVFINGKPVCAHRGGYSPFSCEITEEITEYFNDGENLIAVAVDSTEREDTAPYGDEGDLLHFGGIYREVWLEAVSQTHITDLRVRPSLEPDESWAIDVEGKLSTTDDAEVKFYLYEGESTLIGKYVFSQNGTFRYKLGLQNVKIKPWSPEHPFLYDFIITVGEDDRLTERIGFRDAQFKPEGFFLNGEKLSLIGLSRNQNFPHAGNALPASAQRFDAKLLKKLGCNIVRTGNCPPSKHFLDCCDEIGLLVFAELPGHGKVGGKEWRDCLLTNMEELILRDRHHPSIVLWGVRVEESPDSEPLYTRTNELAKRLDGTRQTAGIRSTPSSGMIAEDVYAFNDFTFTGENAPLEKRRNVSKARIPYLITGFMGYRLPVRSYDTEALRTEQALRHAKILDAAYGEEELCGAIGCSFADYSSNSRSGGADNVCAYGVTDASRVRKTAAYVYESQSNDHPVMELSSALCSGDNPSRALPKVYVFTNCESVRVSRNGKLIGEFYPDYRNFPNLPHPPVVVDDFLGDLLVTEEEFDPKDAAAIKSALNILAREGEHPSDARARSASAMSRYKVTPEQICALYEKYYAGRFGGASFRFEGMKNGRVIRSIVSEPVYETGLRAECDRTALESSDTYDCARIELTAVDQNGNRLWNCFDAVAVECDGSLEVIGSRFFALTGGAAAFFVRTKGGKGKAKVKITTESLGAQIVELDISRVLPAK